MAEIEGGGGSHKKGAKKIRSKKQSTRVDFTPMVDLGFLLITFFMLTTSMNKPQTMEINMPVKDKVEEIDQSKIKESQAMTVLLVKDHKIFYYFGIQDPKLEKTDFSAEGIRKILLKENRDRNASVDSIPIYRDQFQNKKITEEQYKKYVRNIKAYKDGLIVIIKAEDESKYKDLVDILDEMQICNIGRYAIVDISDVEKEMLSKL